MFFIGLFTGGFLGVFIMALFQIEREEIFYNPYVRTVVPEQIECQIHPSFICLNCSDCKGNPNICEWSVLK